MANLLLLSMLRPTNCGTNSASTRCSLGGDKRLMDEQEQLIAPNRLRVIWR